MGAPYTAQLTEAAYAQLHCQKALEVYASL
jgi:hypothetical protein